MWDVNARWLHHMTYIYAGRTNYLDMNVMTRRFARFIICPVMICFPITKCQTAGHHSHKIVLCGNTLTTTFTEDYHLVIRDKHINEVHTVFTTALWLVHPWPLAEHTNWSVKEHCDTRVDWLNPCPGYRFFPVAVLFICTKFSFYMTKVWGIYWDSPFRPSPG